MWGVMKGWWRELCEWECLEWIGCELGCNEGLVLGVV